MDAGIVPLRIRDRTAKSYDTPTERRVATRKFTQSWRPFFTIIQYMGSQIDTPNGPQSISSSCSQPNKRSAPYFWAISTLPFFSVGAPSPIHPARRAFRYKRRRHPKKAPPDFPLILDRDDGVLGAVQPVDCEPTIALELHRITQDSR